MKPPLAQLQTREALDGGWPLLGALSLLAVALAGCAAQKRPTIAWQTAVLVRPVVPATPADQNSVETPDIPVDIAEPAPLAVVRTTPARPRIPPAPAPRETQSGKLEVPQIVPELSTAESTALQGETQQNLEDAERNVAVASRRTLNATQTDLASKVRGFVSDAREAGKAGDWSRARDLSKKAQVLSQELVNSL